MNKSESIAKLTLALSKTQGELSNASKDKDGYQFKYADLASILDIARPLLAQNELAVTQVVGTLGEKITVETTLFHSSGEWITGLIAMDVEPRKGMTHAQNIGSVITYARRYAFAALVGIAQEDDDASNKPTATELQIATFQEIVKSGDAIGLHLIRQRVGDAIYTDLFNSGEKGKKMELKNKVRELETMGPGMLSNIQIGIDSGDDLLVYENLETISQTGFLMLCKELPEEERVWVKEINNRRLKDNG